MNTINTKQKKENDAGEIQSSKTIAAIENGTVIDHINPKGTFDVVKILSLKDEYITIGNNLESKKMGRKGVIKISNKKLNSLELNRISLVSPNATASVIKDYKVIQKIRVEIPEKFEGILKCANPLCITRNQEISTKFYVAEKEESNIKLRCHYCERTFDKEELELI